LFIVKPESIAISSNPVSGDSWWTFLPKWQQRND